MKLFILTTQKEKLAFPSLQTNKLKNKKYFKIKPKCTQILFPDYEMSNNILISKIFPTTKDFRMSLKMVINLKVNDINIGTDCRRKVKKNKKKKN